MFSISKATQSGGGSGGNNDDDDVEFVCHFCNRWHKTQSALNAHIRTVHASHRDDDDDDDVITNILENTQFSNDIACLRLARSSLNHMCRDYEIVPIVDMKSSESGASILDFDMFLLNITTLVLQLIQYGLADYLVKAKVVALLEFVHFNPDTNQPDRRQYFFFHSHQAEWVDDVDQWFEGQCQSVRAKIDKFDSAAAIGVFHELFEWMSK